MAKDTLPECFGNQAECLLDGEMPSECPDCDLFDKCHKITVAGCLQSIADALDLMIENGLSDGRLKAYQELDELRDKKSKQDRKPDNRNEN